VKRELGLQEADVPATNPHHQLDVWEHASPQTT
jgi:hypothetical protein